MDSGQTTKVVLVGIFTVLGIALFSGLVFMFQPLRRWAAGGYEAKIHMPYAGEISRGTRVRHLGIDVGEVRDVEYAPPEQGGVLITVRLREDARVSNDPKAPPYVDTKLVTGEAYIEFPAARRTAPRLKPNSVVEGAYRPTAPDLIAALGDVARTADVALVEVKEAVGDIRDVVKEFGASARKVTDGAADLVEYRPINDPRRPLRPGEENVSTVVQRLDAALANINDLVGDDAIHQDVRITLANLRATSKQLSDASASARDTFKKLRTVADRGDTLATKLEGVFDQAGTLIEHQDVNLSRVGQSVIQTAEHLSTTLAAVQVLLQTTSDGKGAVGKLLADPAFFEQLVRTVDQIGQTFHELSVLVTDLQEHPGDYISIGRRSTSEEERETRIRKQDEERDRPRP